MDYRTIADVARLLKISYSTVRRAIDSGQLEVTRVGRAIRISDLQLRRWLCDGTEESMTDPQQEQHHEPA